METTNNNNTHCEAMQEFFNIDILTERKIKLFYTKTRVLQTRFIILHLLVDSTVNLNYMTINYLCCIKFGQFVQNDYLWMLKRFKNRDEILLTISQSRPV